MEGTKTAAARAAAEWWAKQVGAPAYRATDEHSSPTDQRNMDLAGLMAAMIAERHPVTDDAHTAFVDALEKAIDAQLDGRDYPVSLGVDYGPDRTLAAAAEAAGVDTSRFPWKTHMHVTRDYVTASLGYRAPRCLIWMAPTWERPACNGRQYIDGDLRDALCAKPIYHDGDCGDWMDDPSRCAGCGKSYSGHYADGLADHHWEVTA